MANGTENPEPIAKEFLQHSNEELSHADMISKRIRQLGGEPNFDPDALSGMSHAEYVEGLDLAEMIKENVVAERIAIRSYREFIKLADRRRRSHHQTHARTNPGRRRRHADELASLLEN